MLTKEECENVLSENKIYLKNQMLKKERISHSVYLLNTVTSLLERLIHEHFDNPPLKWEELKEGMWVWDSQLKWFFRISICNVKIENFEYIKFFKVEKYEGGSMLMFYEPNRFYRKQVEE